MELLTSSLLQGQLVHPSLEKQVGKRGAPGPPRAPQERCSISSSCIISPHSWLTESWQPTQFLS